MDEFIMQPYQGHGFELKKGQVVHYELIDGPQILDTVYLVKSRPTEEFADAYPSAQYSSLTYYEGFHLKTSSNAVIMWSSWYMTMCMSLFPCVR